MLFLTFPIFFYPLSAKPHKYKINRELSVVIAPFIKNTDFMLVSEVQILKMGNSKITSLSFCIKGRQMYCDIISFVEIIKRKNSNIFQSIVALIIRYTSHPMTGVLVVLLAQGI